MPFTPFHFGPAALLKSVAPRHFSFSVFCFAQVVTDIEVIVHMAIRDGALHRHLHTYMGATAVGLFSLFAGRPICDLTIRWWHRTPGLPLKEYYDPSPGISFAAALTGAFIGTYSHVFLDSIAHPDVMPWAPFHTFNRNYHLIGPGPLHGLCFVSGVIGAWLCARLPKGKL